MTGSGRMRVTQRNVVLDQVFCLDIYYKPKKGESMDSVETTH